MVCCMSTVSKTVYIEMAATATAGCSAYMPSVVLHTLLWASYKPQPHTEVTAASRNLA